MAKLPATARTPVRRGFEYATSREGRDIVALEPEYGLFVGGEFVAPSAGERALIVLLEGLAVGLVSMMITVFYVVMAQGYPTSCRSGGIGFVITSGRLFSIAMVY